jgi:hypothetical protein
MYTRARTQHTHTHIYTAERKSKIERERIKLCEYLTSYIRVWKSGYNSLDKREMRWETREKDQLIWRNTLQPETSSDKLGHERDLTSSGLKLAGQNWRLGLMRTYRWLLRTVKFYCSIANEMDIHRESHGRLPSRGLGIHCDNEIHLYTHGHVKIRSIKPDAFRPFRDSNRLFWCVLFRIVVSYVWTVHIRYLIANSSGFYLKYNVFCKFVVCRDYYLFSQF